MIRGLISPKGEMFAYLHGNDLYTLEDVHSGRWEGEFILDLAGRPIWRVIGDGVYSLDRSETIGYISSPRPHWAE